MDFLEIEDKTEKEIIYNVFNLNDLQKNIFQTLENSTLTVQELTEEVGRSRSTVQRALQDMVEKDLLMREGKTDRTVYYVYTALPIEELREITLKALNSWHQEVKQKLD